MRQAYAGSIGKVRVPNGSLHTALLGRIFNECYETPNPHEGGQQVQTEVPAAELVAEPAAEQTRPPPTSRGLWRDLLLRGASVAAVVPSHVDEPIDEGAADDRSTWRRVAELGALSRSRRSSESLLAWDTLLAHATRYLLLGPFGYRLVGIAIGIFAIWHAHRVDGFEVVLALGFVLLIWQIVAVVVLLKLKNFSQRLVLPLMLGDLAISTVANLIVAVSAPAVSDQTTVELTWKCLMGTSALWTIGRGVLAGVGVIAYGVLLQEAMLYLHERYVGVTEIPLIANYWDNDMWLASSVASTAIGVAAIAIGTRLAMSLGIRTGKHAERARILRGVHDTVLQTLETISLQSAAPGPDPEQQLTDMGRIASAQAIRLRRHLDRINRVPAELVDGLAEVVAEAAVVGLRVEMAFNLMDESTLSPRHRMALVDAAREAVGNVIKHAEVKQAVLSVTEADDGIQITVRDHGVGFDVANPGFGIEQSITGRMADVGGRASITSKTGSGTRVVLWVPSL
jgi:signal transduction histidine kinase